MAASDDSLHVRRWTGYGQDRLYVTKGGVELGWWDVLASIGHPRKPEHAAVLRQVALQRLGQARPSPPWRAPLAADRPWTDLARNPPGKSVIAQAEQLEARRRAIPWTPRPRRSLIELLTATRDERRQFRDRVDLWRLTTDECRRVDAHLEREAQPWKSGANGEWLVAHEIARLIQADPRWRVLHSVPVGTAGSDIDHVVIGPGGVFTLNTKHHRGANVWVAGSTFLVNRQAYPYVRNSRHEAARAARILSSACGFPVAVRGVIVPVNASRFTVKEQPPDVRVVNRQQLVPWLRGHVESIRAPWVDDIFAVARRSTTWA